MPGCGEQQSFGLKAVDHTNAGGEPPRLHCQQLPASSALGAPRFGNAPLPAWVLHL